MSNRKFELTNETTVFFGKTLFRIRALVSFGIVSKGELGGFVEAETNLDAEGQAWVSDHALVFGQARVSDQAWVSDHALVFGQARVSGQAWVSDHALVFGQARVSDQAWVSDHARVSDHAWVSGQAHVSAQAHVSGQARVSGDADFLLIGPIGSRRAFLTAHADAQMGVRFSTGCFSGTIDDLKASVKATHGNNDYAKQYAAAIKMSKLIVKPNSEATAKGEA